MHHPIEISNCFTDLVNRLPFSPEWNEPELYLCEFNLEHIELICIGLSIQNKDGDEMTASAVGTNAHTLQRAYYELIERVAAKEVVNRIKRGQITHFRGTSISGKMENSLPADKVFPESPVPAEWVYSLSNGIAAHSDFGQACESARLELIERDRILQAAFSLSPIETIDLPRTKNLLALQKHYYLSAHSFGEGTVGIFGIPKIEANPLIMGFGAASHLDLALDHAEFEMLQRLAFLWGEENPTQLPEAAPCGEFHLNYYLHPSSAPLIKKWLNNTQAYRQPRRRGVTEEIYYIDITPSYFQAKLKVIKAISNTRIPLTFGLGFWKETSPLSSLVIHPIA